jgi:hypothetical protein
MGSNDMHNVESITKKNVQSGPKIVIQLLGLLKPENCMYMDKNM